MPYRRKPRRRPERAALDQVLDHFLMADELYRREKFGDAIKEFDQVLEHKAWPFLGAVRECDLSIARREARRGRGPCSALCLAQRSDFVWLYLLRGFAQEELQAWSAADSDFQKASQLPLDDNASYVLSVNRGVLRVRQERFEDAVTDLKSAIERKPRAYQAYVNLAQAYRRLNKLDLALDQLDHAVELEPGLAHIYRLRARLHLERNEPAPALGDFDQAIERENTSSPFQVDDHVERGRLLLSGGRYAEALKSFDAALALQKDHSLGQRLRAETLFRLGRFDEVVNAFDRYLETGKPQESVYRGRGLARAELGQYPGAIEDFTKASSSYAPPRPCRPIGVGRIWWWTRPSWHYEISSWPSSSIPKTATPITAGVSCVPAWAGTARRSRTPRRRSATGRRLHVCSTTRRASTRSAPAPTALRWT